MEIGKRKIGKWKMKNGHWKTKNGKGQKMENGNGK